MPQPPSPTADTLPRWLVLVGSLAIVGHLFVVCARVLAAPSGPWATPEGAELYSPPQFAFSINEATLPYLRLFRLTHDYHFPTNRPRLPGVYFEVRLRDEAKRELAVIMVPEPGASTPVRQRQALLARALADDQPVVPPPGEAIAAPRQEWPTVQIWEPLDPAQPRIGKLTTVKEHVLPRDRPVFRPSEWSLLLARSYGRYLCRTHGAATAELVRHVRDPYPPVILFLDNPQPGAFDSAISNFGELPR